MSEQDTPPCQADGSDGPSAGTLRSQILSKAEGMPPAERKPKVNPIRTARWIWPTPQMDLHNCYAHFRRDFELDKAPDEAPLCITADKAYKLYVNGRFVCRGPARGYQDHWPFDEVDLAGVLQAGHNWLAVEAYTPGISTFQYLHQSWAGLLAGARWGDFELLTGEGWLMRRSPLHTQWTARLSRQMDFQEHVGVRRCGREWITSPCPPEPGAEGWGRSDEGIVFGRPPSNDVEPRGIPLLREELIAPGPVVWHAEGTSGEDYADRYAPEDMPPPVGIDTPGKVQYYQTVRARYCGLIEHCDHEIGRLLDVLEQRAMRKSTIVIFSTDHGDMMGYRDCLGKHLPYDPSARTPVVVRYPGHVPASRSLPAPAESIDLPCSILEAAGLGRHPQGHLPVSPGRSWWQYATGRVNHHRDYAYSEMGAWKMVVNKEWKFVHRTDGRDELYHRTDDPYELNNLARDPQHQARVQQLQRHIIESLSQNIAPPADGVGSYRMITSPLDPQKPALDKRVSESQIGSNKKPTQ